MILFATIIALLLTPFIGAKGQCDLCSGVASPIIFCDDFESAQDIGDRYFEVNRDDGDLAVVDGVGRNGSRGVRVIFQAGEVSAGGLSKSIGRTPSPYIGRFAERSTEDFTEIYWRMDVRHQVGWQGNGPAKLSRALVMANSSWATGMMAHLWSGGPNNSHLIMDPASGIDAVGNLRSTRYNDFANLRWLGIRVGTTPMFSDDSAGRWFCMEAHVKLNTPGVSNGVFEFWVNDIHQNSNTTLNWHGNYNQDPSRMAINAIFFENYWNDGSPIQQERYFDNLVISTERIGCGCGATVSVLEDESAVSDVVSVRYVDILGRALQQPLSGLVIKLTTYRSGISSVAKEWHP